MAKFLIKASYTPEGLTGLRKDGGTGRRRVVEELLHSVDGTLESMYWAFGDTDVFLVCDVPDHVSAVALSMAVNESGAVTMSATQLITADEIDEAAHRLVEYTPPGS